METCLKTKKPHRVHYVVLLLDDLCSSMNHEGSCKRDTVIMTGKEKLTDNQIYNSFKIHKIPTSKINNGNEKHMQKSFKILNKDLKKSLVDGLLSHIRRSAETI